MTEIRNLTRNGETFYPLTHENAVIGMEDFKDTITEQIENYRPIEITGDVTNAPDEEDITSDSNNLLKFKNRNNLYGLGKVILRRGSSFASQVTLANTIYVIQYDFDLSNARVNIPNGSILLFEGGSLSNGTLVCADLYDVRLVYYQDISVILNSVTLEGTFIYKACDKDTTGSISVDNSSIEMNTSNQLSVKAGGIQNTHLNGSVVNSDDLALDSNNKIQLADRPNTGGMGMVILRKNIVNGVNTLTQSMMSQQNTIFVIQYDFTLGDDITVPANCILEFDGGSISGAYTITGNNTNISAEYIKIFGTDVLFSGIWKVKEIYPEWFKSVNDSYDTTSIQRAIDVARATNCHKTCFIGKEYNVAGTIKVSSYAQIYGTIKNEWNSPTCVIIQHSEAALFSLAENGGNGVNISNLKLLNYANISTGCKGIEILNEESENVSRIQLRFSQLHIESFYYGIYAKNGSNVQEAPALGYFELIDSQLVLNSYGIYVNLTNGGWFNAATFRRVHLQANLYGGAYINTQSASPVVFDDCVVEGNGMNNTQDYNGYGIYVTIGDVMISNCYFEVNNSKKALNEGYDITSTDQFYSSAIIISNESHLSVENCYFKEDFYYIIHLGYSGNINTRGNTVIFTNTNIYRGFVALANKVNIAININVNIDETVFGGNLSPVIYPNASIGSHNMNNFKANVNFRYLDGYIDSVYNINNTRDYKQRLVYIGTNNGNEYYNNGQDRHHPSTGLSGYMTANVEMIKYFFIDDTATLHFWSPTDIIGKIFEIDGNSKTLTCQQYSLFYMKAINCKYRFENVKFVIKDSSNSQFFHTDAINNELEFYNCTFKIENNVDIGFMKLKLLSFYNCTFADGNIGHFSKQDSTIDKFINIGGNITF